jgi:hypothetical protein
MVSYGFLWFLKKVSARTAYPTHYLSSKSGFLKKVSAHTAYPTHYPSSKSGFLKKVSAHTAYPTHYPSSKSGSPNPFSYSNALKKSKLFNFCIIPGCRELPLLWSSNRKCKMVEPKAKRKMRGGRAKKCKMSSQKMRDGRTEVKIKMQDGRAK